jgi:hypothetical protein
MADQTLVVDPLPDALQAAVETHTRLLANQQEEPARLQSVVESLLTWDPGGTITVAFLGGSSALHQKIADAATEWTRHANVSLDFGQRGRPFRLWSATDTAYSADIRIGFDNVIQPGYWSLIGRSSIEPNIIAVNGPSMNFGGWDTRLPDDFAATVLHEFGHALGLHHEHSSPAGGCDNEFRFSDDPGYRRSVDEFGEFVPDSAGRRPGIYTVLSGPPNRWSKAKVDFNLRQLPRSSAFDVGPFDNKSIMMYHFPAWMFVRGESSVCFSERNEALSPRDIEGIKRAYPHSESQRRELARRTRETLTAVAETDIDDDLRARIRKRLAEHGGV